MDRRWLTHHSGVTHGFMIAQIVVCRQVGGLPRWDPDTGEFTDGELTGIWRGRARIQDNKDWRIRSVLAANDPQLVHFVRVQIPLVKDGYPPHFESQDVVGVVPPDPESEWRLDADLSSWTLRIRNSINSSNPWLRNLLCAVDATELPFDVAGVQYPDVDPAPPRGEGCG